MQSLISVVSWGWRYLYCAPPLNSCGERLTFLVRLEHSVSFPILKTFWVRKKVWRLLWIQNSLWLLYLCCRNEFKIAGVFRKNTLFFTKFGGSRPNRLKKLANWDLNKTDSINLGYQLVNSSEVVTLAFKTKILILGLLRTTLAYFA